MMQRLTVRKLAVMNLRQKPYRTAALVTLVALAAAVLFGCLVLISSLKNGIASVQRRFGADLLVVPEGAEGVLEGILLNGSPGYFYMDKSVEDAVRQVEGVGQVTSQFFLTSLSEDCCDFPVQLIGFDPQTDFVITPWISEHKGARAGNGIVFAGADVPLEHQSVRLFGRAHTVSGRLAKSGAGMDSAIYTDTASLKEIYADALSRGFGFISDGGADSKISTVLVRLSPGAKPDSTALRIRMAVPGVKVVHSQSFLENISRSLSSLVVFLYALAAVFFTVTVATLAVVFSLMINERLREFSILRTLGATHKRLSGLVLTEAAVLGGAGGTAGIFVSALVVFAFNAAISQKIGLPFITPSVLQVLLFAVATFLASVLSGLLASVRGVVRISRFEPYGGAK